MDRFKRIDMLGVIGPVAVNDPCYTYRANRL